MSRSDLQSYAFQRSTTHYLHLSWALHQTFSHAIHEEREESVGGECKVCSRGQRVQPPTIDTAADTRVWPRGFAGRSAGVDIREARGVDGQVSLDGRRRYALTVTSLMPPSLDQLPCIQCSNGSPSTGSRAQDQRHRCASTTRCATVVPISSTWPPVGRLFRWGCPTSPQRSSNSRSSKCLNLPSLVAHGHFVIPAGRTPLESSSLNPSTTQADISQHSRFRISSRAICGRCMGRAGLPTV